SGGLVRRVLWLLAQENVLVVVGDPRAAILPLGVATATVVINLHPAAFQDRFSRFGADPGEPRNHLRRLGFVPSPAGDVVVGKRDVERIETWGETFRTEITRGVAGHTRLGIGIVVASVIGGPRLIPRRLVVGSRVVLRGFLPNPENGRRDVLPPRVENPGTRLDRTDRRGGPVG